jgi:aspartyl-tRNA(Asn)/glutamyl-tRNA(Gln) amidotransferase subunit C
MTNKKITVDEVKHIAKLSKLDIPDDKLNYYVEEMNRILDYFKIISTVDTSNIEPLTHITDSYNITREDIIGDCINNKEFIDNCPESFGHYIKVPKVLDKD